MSRSRKTPDGSAPGPTDPPGYPARIRAVLAQAPTLVRDGIRLLLGTAGDIALVGDAEDGVTAFETVRTLKPDVLLLDVNIPMVSALDLLRQLLDAGCAPPTILLSRVPLDEPTLATAGKLGVAGVVRDESPSEVLLTTIRMVGGARGRGPAEGGDGTMPTVRRPAPSLRRQLTPRERQVVQLVLDGASNKSIAQSLSLSEDTVKHHLMRVFDKTGVSSRLSLALFVMEHGLLSAGVLVLIGSV